MNITELYIKIKLYLDSLTEPISSYFWGEEYSSHRVYLNLSVAIFVVLGCFVYGAISSNYYYFKLSIVLSALDAVGIIWRYNMCKKT